MSSIRAELKKIDAALMTIGEALEAEAEENTIEQGKLERRLESERREGYDKGYQDAVFACGSENRTPSIQAAKDAAALVREDEVYDPAAVALLLQAVDEL